MASTSSPMKSLHENRGGDFADKGKNAASSAVDKAKDMASGVVDQAKDVASGIADKAKDTASGIGKKAEDATHAVGSGMQSLAGTVRDNLPKQGVLGTASSTIAKGLESGGKYLEKEGLAGIAEDVTNLIRRNPIPALFIGIGLGFLISRATHRS